jgi:glyoxylase-like metal-dependent hydrolase (beta-lactamase superfamily II)
MSARYGDDSDRELARTARGRVRISHHPLPRPPMTDTLALSTHDIVPLDNIASGVVGLRVLFVNVYAISDADGWVLVDAGLRGSAGHIASWARRHFGDAPPRAIVLTHAHFDHVGALPALLQRWNVPVYAHQRELGHVRGERRYPAPDPTVGGGLMARMSMLYPRGPIRLDVETRPLAADGSIDVLPGWQWLPTPGHTAGHVSLFRAADRTLIVGDAFCTTRAESFLSSMTQRPELHGPPAYFTTDWAAAHTSLLELAALEPAVVAPGHGRPMAGDGMARALRQLALRFEELATPRRRDVRRVVRPPAAISPGQHAVLDYGVTLTFLAAGMMLSRTNRRAAQLAYVNAGMVLAMSPLTDYPGGVYRRLSFRTHRNGDVVQMTLAALGPWLLGFGRTPAATFFYGQALSEAAVIAATDWDAAGA